MTLRSLEIFVAVAKTGKMSDAAKELFIAQPTISQTIAELENEYQVRLFERLSKKLYITEAGRRFLSYAQNILNLAKEMQVAMTELTVQKTIHLGATITIGKSILAQLVGSFEKSHPNVKLQVIVDNTATIEDLLLHSKLDIGLIEGTVKSPELHCIPAIPDSLVLVASPTHPLAQKELVTLKDLQGRDFIMREEGSGTRETFEAVLKQNGIQVYAKWTCHGSDSILEAVLADQGLAVISNRLVAPYIRQNQLVLLPIENTQMNRHFNLVYHKTKFLTDALTLFINELQTGSN